MGQEKNAENIPFLRSTQPKSTERVPVVELSGCYAIVPKATAEMAFDGRKLDFLPITDKAPKLTVYMGWHVRTHTDPGMQIIRSTLKELVSGKLGQEK